MAEGEVCLGAEMLSALSEQATWGTARGRCKASERLIWGPSRRTDVGRPISNITELLVREAEQDLDISIIKNIKEFWSCY
jgi:hypothetical protein